MAEFILLDAGFHLPPAIKCSKSLARAALDQHRPSLGGTGITRPVDLRSLG